MASEKKIGNADLLARLLSAHEHIGELREESGTAKFQLSEERAKNHNLRSDLDYWKSHASSIERHAKAKEMELEKFHEKIAHMMCEKTGFEKVGANRLAAISEIRAFTNLGLKEAKDIVDAWLTSKGWVSPFAKAS